MTEVFKSEAAHTLPMLAWCIFIAGGMVGVALMCGIISYYENVSYLPSITAIAIASFSSFHARKNYNLINRYIHFPPNCKIVDLHPLTSDD